MLRDLKILLEDCLLQEMITVRISLRRGAAAWCTDVTPLLRLVRSLSFAENIFSILEH